MNKYTTAEMNLLNILESTVAWNCVNCNHAGYDDVRIINH